MELIVA